MFSTPKFKFEIEGWKNLHLVLFFILRTEMTMKNFYLQPLSVQGVFFIPFLEIHDNLFEKALSGLIFYPENENDNEKFLSSTTKCPRGVFQPLK